MSEYIRDFQNTDRFPVIIPEVSKYSTILSVFRDGFTAKRPSCSRQLNAVNHAKNTDRQAGISDSQPCNSEVSASTSYDTQCSFMYESHQHGIKPPTISGLYFLRKGGSIVRMNSVKKKNYEKIDDKTHFANPRSLRITFYM